jgi:hypothetical protein
MRNAPVGKGGFKEQVGVEERHVDEEKRGNM